MENSELETKESDQSASENTPRFSTRVFGVGYFAKWETRSEKPRKTDSPRISEFPENSEFSTSS